MYSTSSQVSNICDNKSNIRINFREKQKSNNTIASPTTCYKLMPYIDIKVISYPSIAVFAMEPFLTAQVLEQV